MNISGIYPGAGFYNSNSISSYSRVNGNIDTEAEAKVEKTAAEATVDQTEAKHSTARARQTFGAYDYANQYRPVDRISTMSVANIRSNDVDRAISDMQKDNALHQYQYFVKEGVKNQAEVSSVTLRGGEDFSL